MAEGLPPEDGGEEDAAAPDPIKLPEELDEPMGPEPTAEAEPGGAPQPVEPELTALGGAPHPDVPLLLSEERPPPRRPPEPGGSPQLVLKSSVCKLIS